MGYVLPFLVVLLLRLLTILYFNYFSHLNHPNIETGCLYTTGGDTREYIVPWENLIKDGTFSLDGVQPYAGRSPFVGLPYFLFRLFLDRKLALEMVALLQILFSSIATVLMAEVAKKIYDLGVQNKTINPKGVFWGIIIMSSLSTYISFHDSAILSDSVSNSSLCLFLYFHYKYLSESSSQKHLLLSGIFLAISSLWRPYFVLLYLPAAIGILFYSWKADKKISLQGMSKKMFIFIMPLLLMDAPWVIRNILTHKRIIIFYETKSFFTPSNPEGFIAYAKFAGKIGESIVFWEPSTFGCYFEPHHRVKCTFDLSSMSLGPNLTAEKIEKARILYKYYIADTSDLLSEKILIHYFDYLYECYKKDHPLTYWIVPYLKKVKTFLIHSGAEHFPMFKGSTFYNPLVYYGTKVPIAGMYWLMLILGTIGCIYTYYLDNKAYMIPIIPFFLIIFICFIARFDEYRYFIQAYQPMILGTVILLARMIPVKSLKK